MMTPTVSVVIPVYNGEKYLREAILSALEQTYPAKEVIVINDGSTDGTRSVIESFGDRVVHVEQTNKGLAATRNVGAEVATGEWLGFLDADDCWFPDKLEKQVAALRQHPAADLVYSGRTETFPDGSAVDVNVEPFEKVKRTLRFENPIVPSTVVARRSLLLEHPWPEDMRSSEDWCHLHKLSRLTEFTSVPEPAMKFRIHAESMTHTNWKKILSYARESAARVQSEYSGLDRLILHRKVEARLCFNAAVAAREQEGEGFLLLMIQSLVSWPFPDVRPKRYKVFLKMLAQSFGNRNPARTSTS